MSELVTCGRCATVQGRPDDKFCFECGTPFGSMPSENLRKPGEEESKGAAVKLKFCTDCGTSVDYEAGVSPKFCGECGNYYLTHLPEITSNNVGTCPVCSCVYLSGSDGVKYCAQCGTSSSRFEEKGSNGEEEAKKMAQKLGATSDGPTKLMKAGEMTFGTCMTHDVPSVVAQASIGMKVIQEIRELAIKYKKLEESHARALEKMLGEENKKVTRILESDGMCLFGGVWTEFVKHLYGRVDIIRGLGTRVTDEVIGPLKTLESTATMSLKELQKEVKEAQNEMTKNIDALNKTKLKTLETIQVAREALAREKVDTSELSATAKVGHYVASLANRSFVNTKGKALGLANTYIEKIKETNDAQDKYVHETLRGQLEHYQELELQRLQQVAARLQSFALVCKTQDEKMAQQSVATSQVLDSLDPQKDIQTYIQTWLVDYGMPPDTVPYVYDIPLSPSEIDSMADEKDAETGKKRETIFNSTINSLMEKQKVSHPNLDVPLVMQILLDAIPTFGEGLKTEGLFRISCDNLVLRATEIKFNQGDFTLAGAAAEHPHVACSLLKAWMRSLSEPVIPDSMYGEATRCIEIVKQEIAARRSVVARKTLSEKEIKAPPKPVAPVKPASDVLSLVLAFYQKIPNLHRNVIKKLFALAKLIVAQPTSRMTYEALATVFAPCLFRSPDATDPFVALKYNRTEKDFTLNLMWALDQASALPAVVPPPASREKAAKGPRPPPKEVKV